jgi:hypothetical protein
MGKDKPNALALPVLTRLHPRHMLPYQAQPRKQLFFTLLQQSVVTACFLQIINEKILPMDKFSSKFEDALDVDFIVEFLVPVPEREGAIFLFLGPQRSVHPQYKILIP